VQVCRFLGHPVPYQKFWLYWCDGLNRAELLVVLVWMGAHLASIIDFINYSQRAYDARRPPLLNPIPTP
jgi:hypothetical protein